MMQHILIVNILVKRTISDKILRDKDDEIARNCRCDGYQRALASMIYKIFDKKTGPEVRSKSTTS